MDRGSPVSNHGAYNGVRRLHTRDSQCVGGSLIVGLCQWQMQEWRHVDMFRHFATFQHGHCEASLQHRLQDWQRVYAQMDTSPGEQTPFPAIATPPVAAITETATTETGPRQLVIDVVVIRSIRNLRRRRGINLLEGLNLQYSYSKTTTNFFDTQQSPLEFEARTVTRALGIPEINYSLNIFNTTDRWGEIIARPSLLATEGHQSSFFLGLLFIAPLQGTFEAEALEERVGVTLKVTPTFISDDEFLLDVFIEDSEFVLAITPGTFKQALLVSIAEASVMARIRLGQTLLLAGLTERQVINTQSKVPILGDIPLVQTFFKRKESEEVINEAMILLTPRRAIDTARPPTSAPTPAGQFGSQRVQDLHQSYLQPFTPASNYHALLYHMGQSEYFQQFRTGDLRLEVWKSPGHKRFWEDVLAYLYF